MTEYVKAVWEGRLSIPEPLEWNWLGLAAMIAIVGWLLVDAIRVQMRQ